MESKELWAGLAVLGIVFVILIAIALAVVAICFVCNWILFKKAGEPGWAAIVPIYNTFTMSKIAFGNYNWAIAWVVVWGVQVVLSMIGGAISSIEPIAAIGALFSLGSSMVGLLSTVISGVIMFFFSKSFGKSTAWNVLMIFFSPIMLILTVLDKTTEYVGPSEFGEEWFDKIKGIFNKA